MKKYLIASILIVALLLTLSACAAEPVLEQAPAAETAIAETAAVETAEAEPASEAVPETQEEAPAEEEAEPITQSGELNMTLLDDYYLCAILKSYKFTADDSIELNFFVSNHNAERGTIWVIFNGINGWDVTTQQQGTAVLAVYSGEEREDTVRFSFADDPNAKYMAIRTLEQLDLGVEGYVDSYNYEFKTTAHTIDLSQDAAKVDAASEGTAFETLADNDWLTLSYCGENEDTGSIVLCLEVKQPVEGAEFKLYPIEQGVFDTEKYIALNSNSLAKARKTILNIDPVLGSVAGEPSEFVLMGTGAAMKPVYFDVPNRTPSKVGYESLPVIAENEAVRIRYDALNRRFVAENLTDDTLVLTNRESFLLDGNEVRANAQELFVFAGSATAFRANGRGQDAKGVMRNITITADNSEISIGWDIAVYADGMSEATPLSSIEVENAKLR